MLRTLPPVLLCIAFAVAVDVCGQERDRQDSVGILKQLSSIIDTSRQDVGGDTSLRSYLKAKVPQTRGRLEIGGVHGQIPYSVPTTSSLNAFAKGAVALDLLGVPIGVTFDVGTDQPLRGQRNSIRFSFSPSMVLEREKRVDAKQLHLLHTRLDSLENERGRLHRELLGNEARLNALRSRMSRSLPSDLDGMDLGTVPSSDPRDTLYTMPPYTPIEMGGDVAIAVSEETMDSLGNVVLRKRSDLTALEERLREQRMHVQRLTAVINATKGPDGLARRVAQGIKRLEVGSCSPSSSEFLINGINFQGVSFEYARKDLFLAFDRGRSFDDTWVNADPVANRVRQLQESLFMTDVRDLNPRKLTAIRMGFGAVKGTHAHVGYLNGSRYDAPLGMYVPDMDVALSRNHVVELDLGYELLKGHSVRAVLARSAVRSSSAANEDPDADGVGALLEIGADRDQALKLIWSSDIERTRTNVDLELRTISPFFQSYGMGFIRNASKAGELRVDQSVGSRLRLRGRAVLEERAIINAGPGGTMSLFRAQLLVNYRLNRSVTLRLGFLPVRTRTEFVGGPSGTSGRSYTVGGEVRERWRALVAVLSVDGGLFEWSATNSVPGRNLNQNVGLTLQHEQGWSGRAAWSGSRTFSDSASSAVHNLTLQAGYRSKKGMSMDLAVRSPSIGRSGWMVACQRPLSKKLMLAFKGESYARSDLFFSEEVGNDPDKRYTWTVSMILSW